VHPLGLSEFSVDTQHQHHTPFKPDFKAKALSPHTISTWIALLTGALGARETRCDHRQIRQPFAKIHKLRASNLRGLRQKETGFED
jgi:hypothetical protein